MTKDYVPYEGPIVTRKEAQEQGLKRYFNGEPCKRGHVSERATVNQLCQTCSREASRQYAAKKRIERPDEIKLSKQKYQEKNKDLLNARARARTASRSTEEKLRVAARQKEYYEANREKILSNAKKYHEENKDARNAACMEWYNANREYANQRSREYHEANKDTANEKRREWRINNPEQTKESMLAWHEANPEKRSEYWLKQMADPQKRDAHNAKSRKWNKENPESRRAHKHARRARIAETGGSYTPEDAVAIRKLQKDRCAYCKAKLGGKGHLDHITPLSLGGNNDKSNLQWTCAPCNLRKNAKPPERFAREIGLLI